MIVIFDHCVNEFMPSFRHMGSTGMVGAFKDIIAMSPLNIVYSGLTPVFIFFALSGFVLSYKFFDTGDIKYVVNGALKRFPRLAIPVFGSMLFMYLLSIIASCFTGSGQLLPLSSVFTESLYKAFFVGGPLINGPLWTMKTEFIGSMLVFSLLIITHSNKYRLFTYLISMLYFLESNMILFIFGVFLCDAYTTGYLKDRLFIKNKYMKLSLLLISIYLVSYPTIRNHVEVVGIYKLLEIDALGDVKSIFRVWHVTGVFILFYCVINTKVLKSFFSRNTCLLLGKLSFSAYVLHYPIIIFMREIGLVGDRSVLSLFTMSAIVFITTLSCSVPFEKYIDRFSVWVSSVISKSVMNAYSIGLEKIKNNSIESSARK